MSKYTVTLRKSRPSGKEICSKCGIWCPDEFRVSGVDESNHAISKNMPEMCPECFCAGKDMNAYGVPDYQRRILKSWLEYKRNCFWITDPTESKECF